MSTGKGSIQQGAPTTTVNPAQVSQQPYLDYGYQQSQNLYQNQPQQYYPGQTLATPSPYTAQGYNDIYNTGQSIDQSLRPTTNAAYTQAATGGYGVQNSPAYGGYQSYATGQSYPASQQAAIGQAAVPMGNQYAGTVGGYGQQAATSGQQYAGQVGGYAPQQAAYSGQLAANNNLGLSQLGQTSSGYYLPGQAGANPYLQPTIDAALDPLNRNYQTVTAPQTDAAASMSGRYGSGAQAGQISANEQNYLEQAGDITSKMSYDVYNAERQRQDAAAQQYGSLYNQGLTGGIQGLGAAGTTAYNAGNLANQGYQTAANAAAAAGGLDFRGLDTAAKAANDYAAAQQYGLTGLQSGYNTGNQAATQAMQYYPQLVAAQYSAPNAAVQAGQGLTAQSQAQIADEMARYYGMQSQPYTNLNTYLTQIGMGNPQAGSNTKTESAYTDPFASALSGVAGAAGIAGSLGWAPLAGLAI